LTDIGAEYGDVRPLDAARVRRLTVNRVQLLDLIDSNRDCVTELATDTVGCITRPQRDHLRIIEQSRDRTERLLELLSHRSVASFKQFIRVLSKYQSHLVPLLVTDGGETVLCVSDNFQLSVDLLIIAYIFSL